MKCLMCGDCCIHFDIPELNKPYGERCKYLTDDNKCSVWDKPERPDICWRHDFPSMVCPIGTEVLSKRESEKGGAK